MAVVMTDTRGRLLALHVVPPDREDEGANPERAPDWAPLLHAAGLDAESLERVEPTWVPPSYADERVRLARYAFAAEPGLEMRFEAAAFRGRPVYFRSVGPWTRRACGPANRRPDAMPTAFTPQQLSFTLGQIGLNLALAFALSFVAASVYRKVNAGPGDTFSFYVTLLVTPVVVAMIMMAIGSNVALSLGLVGALSIIRFRTVIKDSRDMAYLFLVIAIGLCCGSGGYPLAIVGTVFVCAVVFVVHAAGRTGWGPSEYILVFRNSGGGGDDAEQELAGLTRWRKLHGAADLGEDEGCEFTYRIRLNPDVTPASLLDRLRASGTLSRPSLISPESQLAV